MLSCFDFAGFKDKEICDMAEFVSIGRTHTSVKAII